MVSIFYNQHTSRGRKVSKDFVYIDIKQKIINGELEPEQPLIEENLANVLEVSRTPLREALQRLEMEQLVIRQPNGRLRVAPVSAQEVEEIFEVRGMLEGIVAREATINAKPPHLENLQTITEMIVEASKLGKYEEAIYYGDKFHSYLYELSENQTVVKILYQLKDHINRYRQLGPLVYREKSIKTANDHSWILEFIINKDKVGAEKAMKEHIERSLANVKEAIEAYQQEKRN